MNSVTHTINVDMSRHPSPFLQGLTPVRYFRKAKTTVLFTLLEVRLECIHRKYVKEISRAKKINCLHLSNTSSKLNKCDIEYEGHLSLGEGATPTFTIV